MAAAAAGAAAGAAVLVPEPELEAQRIRFGSQLLYRTRTWEETLSACGLPLHVPDAWLGWFRKGTSPADWTATPDRQSVLHALTDLPARLAADYEAGVFTAFQPYETSTGITLHTLADALAFNNIHEGMHVGTILALRRHVR